MSSFLQASPNKLSKHCMAGMASFCVAHLQGNLADECAGVLQKEWTVHDPLLLLRWVRAAGGMTAITSFILQPLYSDLLLQGKAV